MVEDWISAFRITTTISLLVDETLILSEFLRQFASYFNIHRQYIYLQQQEQLVMMEVHPLQDPIISPELSAYLQGVYDSATLIDFKPLPPYHYVVLTIRIYNDPIGLWVLELNDQQDLGAQSAILHQLVKYLGNHLYVSRLIKDFESRFLDEMSLIDHAAQHREQQLIQRTRTEAMYDFIQMSNHDLRTPLTVIRNATYMLRHLATAEERERKLERIDASISNLERKVDQINLIVKLQHPQVDDFYMNHHSLKAIRAYIEDQILPKLDKEQKIIQLTTQITCEAAMVYVDLEYIGTALYNLLENALRYAAKQVQLQFQCEERMLVITVTDDGPGIPAEIKERIFEPFYRGETHRPQNAAHGLGLPTARLIIERFKGTLAIDAGQPAGTSVEIRLPRISSE